MKGGGNVIKHLSCLFSLVFNVSFVNKTFSCQGFEDRFLDLCVSTSDAKLDELDRTSEAIESKSIGALKISNDVDSVTKGGTLSEEANADSFEDLCKLEPGDIVEYGNYQAHGDSHVSGNGIGTETRSAKGPKALNNSGDKKKSKKKDPFPRKPAKKTPTGILIKNKMRKQGRVQDHLIKELSLYFNVNPYLGTLIAKNLMEISLISI